jgi:hypothetical protein
MDITRQPNSKRVSFTTEGSQEACDLFEEIVDHRIGTDFTVIHFSSDGDTYEILLEFDDAWYSQEYAEIAREEFGSVEAQ